MLLLLQSHLEFLLPSGKELQKKDKTEDAICC